MRPSSLLGSLSIYTAAVVSAGSDWRGDPCARAGIPWSPFSTHARLDPRASVARVVTRSNHLRHLRLENRVRLVPGTTEEVIVVDFRVLLSDEALQSSVWMVQHENDVALMVDGTDVGDDGQEECVVAVTHVSLPPRLHHLVVDVDVGDIEVQGVAGTMARLDLKVGTGAIKVDENQAEVESLSINVGTGHYETDGSLYASQAQIKVVTGSVQGTILPAGGRTAIDLQTGSVRLHLAHHSHGRKDEPLEQSAESGFAFVQASVQSGSVDIDSHLRTNADISVQSRTGPISFTVRGDVSADVHLDTAIGTLHFPRTLHVTAESKSVTGRMVQGTLGASPYRMALDLKTHVGSVSLLQSADRLPSMEGAYAGDL